MKLEVHNPEPTYIKIDNFISDRLANILTKIVDEWGTEVNYHGAEALEHRIPTMPNMISCGYRDEQNCNEFEALIELNKLIKPLVPAIDKVFNNTACECIVDYREYRIMKYYPGGHFEEHVDFSTDDDEDSIPAVYTLTIHLNDGYIGGEILLNGSCLSSKAKLAYVWDGWTYHEVKPVMEGNRYILLVHFIGKLKD
jgi:hypothetical protein